MTANSTVSTSDRPSLNVGERRRVVVAMSGGVDSSVVAALLTQAGHEVIGITLQLYDHGAAVGRKGACCAGQDIQDARNVASRLGIPHYVLDYEDRFAATVIASFADSYVAGETPIPCVNCNSQIKFGADALATGHYIRRREGPAGPELARARDAERDQSYFLFTTTREQLAQLWFPLGDLPKSDVRTLARDLDLPVADKPDSQDICFVPSGRYSDIIERLKPEAMTPGDIVHVDGRRVGQHQGIVHYTVGQRRGLGVAFGEPLFVIRLDAGRNEVIVGPRSYLDTRRIVLRNVNWIGDGILEEAAREGLTIHARVRSTQQPQPAVLSADNNGEVSVVLTDPAGGIATGQACVFYSDAGNDARILGGGWIAATKSANDDVPLARPA